MSELCECSSILWVLFKCVDVVLNDVTAAILRRLFNSTTVAPLTLTTLKERKNNSKNPSLRTSFQDGRFIQTVDSFDSN